VLEPAVNRGGGVLLEIATDPANPERSGRSIETRIWVES